MKTLPEEILNELLSSASDGHVICIRIKNQSRLLITAVESVPDPSTVILKTSSMTGNAFQPRLLAFNDIESVIHLNALYEDALKNQVDEIKKALE